LYVVFIGGNDIRAAIYETDSVVAETIIKTAASKIRDAIQSLKQTGARSFYVIGAPDIASIPETSLMAAALNNPELLTRASELTKSFNNILHRTIEQLEEDNKISISEFNLEKLFAKVLQKASSLGFTNKTDACFSSITFTFHPDCNYGLNIDQFVFFDEIHPTARVHTIFGEAFYKELIEEFEEENED
jgi:outer membrane lipase/esterase